MKFVLPYAVLLLHPVLSPVQRSPLSVTSRATPALRPVLCLVSCPEIGPVLKLRHSSLGLVLTPLVPLCHASRAAVYDARGTVFQLRR